MARSMVEYLSIFVFFCFSTVLSGLILMVAFLCAPKNPGSEKVTPYECGFDPFDDARSRFDIRFYLVAILFIIFDLEVTFLFPWALVFTEIGSFGFWSMFWFLLLLTLGFVYEWSKGALNW